MARYNKKIVKRICELHENDSYTIAEICKIVGIAECTYYDWQAKKTEFSEAIKKAKDRFDEKLIPEAKRSLRKKVNGYEVIETRTVTEDTGKTDDKDKPIVKIKQHTKIKKHIAPDTAAIIFTLTNRDPDNWKNRQDTSVSGDVTLRSELEGLSDDELRNIINNGGKIEENSANKGT